MGTDDAGATDLDPDGSGGANNLVRVSTYEYDENTAGNGNLTALTLHPGGGAADRVSRFFHDWRDRLVASKGGVQGTEGAEVQRPVTYLDLNNLGEVTASSLYDGDGVSLTSTNGVPNKPSASLLRARSEASYDEQGRAFQSRVYGVDQGTGAVSSSALIANTFFDRRGNVIKTASPGGLVTKAQYNGAGWVSKAFVTDGGGDAGWADAGNVAGDRVLSQSGYTYDANGNVILGTSKQRFHDEAGTGELGDPNTGPKARVSYAAFYYDAADRLTAGVDVGTNGGAAYARPASTPVRSDTALVTGYGYDAGGWARDMTDPRGIVARAEHDLLGRTTKTIEAYADGTPSAADDRTTKFTHDGAGNVLSLTADLPSENVNFSPKSRKNLVSEPKSATRT